jgi:hypothetical protein
VAEFFDEGESRTVAWGRRPQAAALVAQLADPNRGWDAHHSALIPLYLADTHGSGRHGAGARYPPICTDFGCVAAGSMAAHNG